MAAALEIAADGPITAGERGESKRAARAELGATPTAEGPCAAAAAAAAALRMEAGVGAGPEGKMGVGAVVTAGLGRGVGKPWEKGNTETSSMGV